MKRISSAILTLITLIILGLAAILFLYEGYEWNLESEKISPDGEWGMYHYTYMSDGFEHAPYGTYLFLQPARKKRPPYKGYVIFAGYCDEITYTWLNEKEVDINCKSKEDKNIKTFSKKAYGVSINVNEN